VVSFFNNIEIKKPCSKTFVSFFSEVASEMQKISSEPLFHFLTRLPQRNLANEYRRIILQIRLLETKTQELRLEEKSIHQNKHT
jgi:hypothetical protein